MDKTIPPKALPEISLVTKALREQIFTALAKATDGLELDPKNKRVQKLLLQAATCVAAEYAAEHAMSSASIGKYSYKGASYVAGQVRAKEYAALPNAAKGKSKHLNAVPDVDEDEGDDDENESDTSEENED